MDKKFDRKKARKMWTMSLVGSGICKESDLKDLTFEEIREIYINSSGKNK